MRELWFFISNLGLRENPNNDRLDRKRLVFFNQVLFIGVFATLSQIVLVWHFIQELSLIFLGVVAVLIACLYLNSIRQFRVSKWIYLISVSSMGVLTTILLGGAALYHLQALLIFTSCLILFDIRKELPQILLSVPFLFMSILIGEFNWFGAPDYSNYELTEILRFANIFSLIFINTILTLFIIRLNAKNEEDLSDALAQLTVKTTELERGNDELEWLVEKRTAELLEQKAVLELQNEEKNILLKEVHHRVQNNLQIIISLINLQLAKIDDGQIRSALNEIQGRVKSMSLVHQKMYQSSNFKEIDMEDYTRQIIDNLQTLYGLKDFNCEVDIPENFALRMEAAIPVGLVINEIAANYFKHVNSTTDDSFFRISITKSADRIHLKYSDNGPGFQESIDADNLNSLGLLLIDSLAEQLEGEFRHYNENGAVYEIFFPVKEE